MKNGGRNSAGKGLFSRTHASTKYDKMSLKSHKW
jgi:hypothetical protein